ncbi:MAG: hypothetical protein RB191_19830 [Terriglobia bacterium]|nr:hypothetical protein [Terriglobia bacterium]
MRRGNPKLSDAQVREIRAWYEAVRALPSAVEMARKHRICTGTLYGAARGLWHKRVA